MTRRLFIKRTGGATVASAVAWNLSAATGLAAGAGGSGSVSYKLEGTWAGTTGNYSEHIKTGLRLSSPWTSYDVKLKMWTSPASGVSRNRLDNRFAIEIFEIGAGDPKGAPTATSLDRVINARIPNVYVEALTLDPYNSAIIEAYSPEGDNPEEYFMSPSLIPHQEGIPAYLVTAFPPPFGTYKAHYYSSPYAKCALSVSSDSKQINVSLDLLSKVIHQIEYYDSSGTLINTPIWTDFDGPKYAFHSLVVKVVPA